MEENQPGHKREDQFDVLSDLLPTANDQGQIREQSGSIPPDYEILDDFCRVTQASEVNAETALCGCISSCGCAKCECISKDSSSMEENVLENPAIGLIGSPSASNSLQTLYQNILDEVLGNDQQPLSHNDIEKLANDIFRLLGDQ